MIAALGSPIRSPAPHRQARSTPPSPLPRLSFTTTNTVSPNSQGVPSPASPARSSVAALALLNAGPLPQLHLPNTADNSGHHDSNNLLNLFDNFQLQPLYLEPAGVRASGFRHHEPLAPLREEDAADAALPTGAAPAAPLSLLVPPFLGDEDVPPPLLPSSPDVEGVNPDAAAGSSAAAPSAAALADGPIAAAAMGLLLQPPPPLQLLQPQPQRGRRVGSAARAPAPRRSLSPPPAAAATQSLNARLLSQAFRDVQRTEQFYQDLERLVGQRAQEAREALQRARQLIEQVGPLGQGARAAAVEAAAAVGGGAAAPPVQAAAAAAPVAAAQVAPAPAAAAPVAAAQAQAAQPAAQVPVAVAAPAPVALAQPHVRNPETDLEPGVWLLPEEAAVDGAEAGTGAAIAADDAKATTRKYSEPVKVFMRSINSTMRSRVTFANDSDGHVTAFWVDYNGQEVPYGGLLPGQAKIYETYVSHPWVFRSSATGERMLLGGRTAHYAEPPPPPPPTGLEAAFTGAPKQVRPPRVAINKRPLLMHTPETHAAFPADFKATSRALLLAHQRLQRPDLQRAAEVAEAARRTVADVIYRTFRNVVTSVMSAAQPAIEAIGVCAPASTTASSSSTASTSTSAGPLSRCSLSSLDDRCHRYVGRWLDGTPLTLVDEEAEDDQGEDEEYGSGARGQLARHSAPGLSAVPEPLAPPSPASPFVHTAETGVEGGCAAVAAAGLARRPQSAAASCSREGGVAVSGSGTSRQLSKREAARAAAEEAEVEREREATKLGSLLASLPVDLIRHIIHLAAPVVAQDVALGPRGHPDIPPVVLPSDPATWPERQAQPA